MLTSPQHLEVRAKQGDVVIILGRTAGMDVPMAVLAGAGMVRSVPGMDATAYRAGEQNVLRYDAHLGRVHLVDVGQRTGGHA